MFPDSVNDAGIGGRLASTSSGIFQGLVRLVVQSDEDTGGAATTLTISSGVFVSHV